MTDLIPNNANAEKAVLGSILIYPPAFIEASKYLTADDFYIDRHKWIYAIFEKFARTHTSIDALTLTSELESQSKLQSVGGEAFITGLINDTPTAMNCEHYSKIVAEMATRRRMIQSASDLAMRAYDTKEDIEIYIPQHINQLLKNLHTENKTEHISVGLSQLYDDIERRSKDPHDIYGIETGITGIDRITGGFQKGEMFLLSGEPGLGKSLLAMQMAFHMGKVGRAGTIYELEMSKLQTLRRNLSGESGVPVRTMKTGNVTENQWPELTVSMERLESLPIYLSDSTSWTTASLRSDLLRLKTLYGIEWFIVDYLRLLKDRFDGKEPERIGYIASLLHDICKDLDLAGIAIQSMTKEGMKGGGMTGLYGGSEQQHSADVIAVMEKSGQNTIDGKDIINLKFEKNREADTDKNMVQLVIKQGFPVFEEWPKKP